MEQKKSNLLALLKTGERLTYWSIMHKVGTTSPRDLICKLRKEGWHIKDEQKRNANNNGQHKVFWL